VRIFVGKILQELVCRAHDDLHAIVFLLFVGYLGQIEHNVVHAQVAQQTLVIATRSLHHCAIRSHCFMNTQLGHGSQRVVQLFVFEYGRFVHVGPVVQLFQHELVLSELVVLFGELQGSTRSSCRIDILHARFARCMLVIRIACGQIATQRAETVRASFVYPQLGLFDKKT